MREFLILFLGSAMLTYSIRAYGLLKENGNWINFVFMALFPIGNVALYGSIYITIAVSIERFLGKSIYFKNVSNLEPPN